MVPRLVFLDVNELLDTPLISVFQKISEELVLPILSIKMFIYYTRAFIIWTNFRLFLLITFIEFADPRANVPIYCAVTWLPAGP